MDTNSNNLWNSIERDRLKYKFILFFSIFAWAVAMSALVYIGYVFYLEYIDIKELYVVGAAQNSDVYQAKKNIYSVVLAASIILAILSSVLVLMKQRAASLLEIQMRLAFVEQHLDHNK